MAVKREQAGKQVRGDLIAIIVVALVLICLAAMYQQNLYNFWRLQGWNQGAVKQTMEQFVKAAYDGDVSGGELLDPGWGKPVMENGKFVGFSQPGARGPVTTKFRSLFPDGTVKDCKVRIKDRSGYYQADVQFSNGQWAPFDVNRVNGALRVRTVPEALSPKQPPVQPWD